MAEKLIEDLPPSYSNLGCDFEPAPGPSAPKFSEGSQFEGGFREFSERPSAPPPQYESIPGNTVYKPPDLVFENIYEACVKYAEKHCCYGKRFLNQMKLLDIINKVVFYYKLESFGEKRESLTKSKPYKDGQTDGPENGMPPDPWDITVLPPNLFEDCEVTTKVPHTEIVDLCSNCSGNGNIRCHACDGSGNKPCLTCSGTGTVAVILTCKTCHGSGKRLCWSCVGIGSTTCPACNGHKRLQRWKILNVTWKNHVSEHFTDADNLPKELIRKATGEELVKMKDISIQPITDAPDATVIAASARLLEAHKNDFPNEMIIQQRQILKAMPVTRVVYQWKQRDGEFYVYDTDKKVYFEDYPQNYCCCS